MSFGTHTHTDAKGKLSSTAGREIYKGANIHDACQKVVLFIARGSRGINPTIAVHSGFKVINPTIALHP